MFGLPLHFWGKATFEVIRARCGCLIDGGVQDNDSMEWVKLRVRRPEEVPDSLWFVDDELAFKIALWAPMTPKCMPVAAMGGWLITAGERKPWKEGREGWVGYSWIQLA